MAGGAGAIVVHTKWIRLFAALLAVFVASPLPAKSSIPTEHEIDRKIAKIERIRALPEWVWLEGEDEIMVGEPATDGGVYFAGFYSENDITPARLRALRRHPLIPNWDMFERREIDPIRVIWFPVPGKPGLRCGGLIQIVRAKNPAPLEDSVSDIVRRWETYLPERPLDENCRLGPPPKPNIESAIREEVPNFGPILIERSRSCDEFANENRGVFSLSPDTRIEYQRIIFEPVKKNIYRYHSHHYKLYFNEFIDEFNFYMKSRRIRSSQVLTYGNYDVRPQDLILKLRIFEDASANKFCYIATALQGESIRQIVRSEPRNGKVLDWNRRPGHLEEANPREWIGDFGKQLATAIFAPAPETNQKLN